MKMKLDTTQFAQVNGRKEKLVHTYALTNADKIKKQLRRGGKDI